MTQPPTDFSPRALSLSRVIAFLSAGGLVLVMLGWLLLGSAPLWLLAIGVVGSFGVAGWVYVDFDSIAELLSARGARSQLGSLLGVGLVLTIAVVLNGMAAPYHQTFDWTSSRVHSLSPQTLQLLEALPAPIHVVGYYREDPEALARGIDPRSFRRLLRLYQQASREIRVETVDPEAAPLRAREDGIQQNGTVLVRLLDAEGAVREERLSAVDEYRLSNAIARLIRPDRPTVYFTTGHGEHSVEDPGPEGYRNVADQLIRQGLTVESLAPGAPIPDDARVVVVAGARAPFQEGELVELQRFAEERGSLFVLVDPRTEHGLSGLLASLGVELREDLVLDSAAARAMGEGAIPISYDFGDDPITRDLRLPVAMPLTRSLVVSEERATVLLRSAAEAWAETRLVGFDHRFDEGEDVQGPLVLAARLPLAEDPERALVVMGDSDFAANRSVELFGNRDLFLNAVSALAGRAELVSVRARSGDASILAVTPTQQGSLLLLAALGVPGLCAMLALVSWWRNR